MEDLGAMKQVGRSIALVLASLFLLLSGLAVYVQRQVLDNQQWTETSTALLQNPTVRNEISLYIVDQIYANVDVSKEISKALPEQLDPLSGALAGGLRNLAVKGADEALAQPPIQSVWADANSATHQTLVDFLEGDTGALSASNGQVTLDLSTLAQTVGDRLGISNLQDKLPADAANLKLADSQQLKSAQTAVKVLKGTSILFALLALLFFALYIFVAANRRRAVINTGIAFIAVGILTLVIRSVAGSLLVSQLVTNMSLQPAASDTWDIVTGLLSDQGWALVFYGVVAIAGGWLAGPSGAAKKAREAVAPWADQPVVAWIAFVVVIALLIAWAPVEGLRHLWSCLLVIAIAGIGFEFLRRQTAREFPDAESPDWEKLRRNASKKISGIGESVRGKTASTRRRAEGIGGGRRSRKATESRLDEIQRLQELKKSGALTAKEFAAEKKRILDS